MCEQGRPAETPWGIRFFAGEVADAYLQRERLQRGYTVVIWRGRHVAEPTELSAEEATKYWLEVLEVGRRLERRLGAGEAQLRPARELAAAPPHPRHAPLRGRPQAGLAVPASRGRKGGVRRGVAARRRRRAEPMSALDVFTPETRAWFAGAFAGADAGAGARLARDRARRPHPDPGADRLGQDARGVPVRDRPAEGHPRRGPPPPLRLPAQGAELRRRAEPARTAGRARQLAGRRGPHRRHAAEGARGDAAQAPGHPDHDARVALPAAHVARPREPERRSRR